MYRVEGGRPVGRPRKTWLESVEVDMAELEIDNELVFLVPTTPACAWWNRPEEDNSSGKLESTHPSRTSVKSDQGFFGVE